jgi:magnesium transporter
MKTLTSISAVFIPLTFVVGVYGMNFKHFPELEWKYGYLFIWLIMLLISGLLVAYMKKKRWF